MTVQKTATSLLLLMLAVHPAAHGQDQPRLTSIAGDEGTYDWIVQEATGRIFASSPLQDRLLEYDPADASQVRQFVVKGQPRQLLIKNHWLVVGARKPARLTVIDLKANEVAGAVPLAGDGPFGLFCSGARHPFVYGVCYMGNRPHDGEIFQVDLSNLTVRNRVNLLGWRPYHPVHAVMSADGKWVVLDARGVLTPSGAALMSVDEQTCTFAEVRGHHKDFGQIVAGPSNRYWTLGSSLFPLDIESSLREFAGQPVAIHPHLNLAVSCGLDSPTDAKLHFQSFTAAKPLAEVAFPAIKPAPAKRARRPSEAASDDPTLMFDLPGNRVFFGLANTAVLVDLASLGVAFQPRLTIDAPSLATVQLGQSLRLRLSVTDNAQDPGVDYELASGPQGAEVSNGQLVWTPTVKDLGEHTLRIKATRNDLTDTLAISIHVRLPTVPLGFFAHGLAVERGGRGAACWGPKSAGVGHPGIAAQGPCELALVDLQKAQISARKSLPTGIRLLELDDKYVYLCPTSGSVLYRFNRDDLATTKRLFLSKPLQHMACLPGNALALYLNDMRQSESRVLDRETLEPVAGHPGNRVLGHGSSMGAAFFTHTTPSTCRLLGQIYDLKTGDLRCLVESPGLPLLSQAALPGIGHPGHNAREIWGRRFTNNSLFQPQGASIAAFSALVSNVSAYHPFAVSLQRQHQEQTMRLTLEIRDLVLGSVVQSSTIDASDSRSANLAHQCLLEITADKIAVAQGNRLLIAPVPKETVAKIPVPLHLEYPQIPVASVDKPLSFRLTSRGGTGRPKYALLAEADGISMDASSGEVRVDLPHLWKHYLATATGRGRTPRLPPISTPGTSSTDPYTRGTGKTLPDGQMALSVPLQVAVADDEGQQGRLNLFVVALAPEKEFRDVIAARQKEMQLAQEKARAEADRRRRELEMQKESQQSAETREDADRIGQLEKRIRRIEAALDAVLDRLEELEKRPADQ